MNQYINLIQSVCLVFFFKWECYIAAAASCQWYISWQCRCQRWKSPRKMEVFVGNIMGNLLNISGNIGKHLVNGGLKFNWLIFSLLWLPEGTLGYHFRFRWYNGDYHLFERKHIIFNYIFIFYLLGHPLIKMETHIFHQVPAFLQSKEAFHNFFEACWAWRIWLSSYMSAYDLALSTFFSARYRSFLTS